MPVKFGLEKNYKLLSQLRKAWEIYYDNLGLSRHRASVKIRMRINNGKMPLFS